MDNLYIHFQLALFVADAGDGDVSDDGCHGIQMRVVGIGPAMDASLGAVISQDGLSSGCQLQIVDAGMVGPVKIDKDFIERHVDLAVGSVVCVGGVPKNIIAVPPDANAVMRFKVGNGTLTLCINDTIIKLCSIFGIGRVINLNITVD